MPAIHSEFSCVGKLSHWIQDVTLSALLSLRTSSTRVRAIWEVFILAVSALLWLREKCLLFGK